MIELKRDQLIFRFPEVHKDAECRISFQRTLRIPDDNRAHFLPPGLGEFPLNLVDDYADSAPPTWSTHGGVFLPMYQAEAMWLDFDDSYPMAVKVAAGKINAVTGERWETELSNHSQDYLVIPDQPWLDGFCVMKGMIRQFVAMLLGEGYTAEEQLTGEAEHGGLQIVVYPMKRSYYRAKEEEDMRIAYAPLRVSSPPDEMGLAPGGLMRQEIYEDDYGFDAWDTSVRSRCFVHIINSVQFFNVTGANPPSKPPTAREYANAGLPWFDYYGGDLEALEGAQKLAGLDSVAAKKLKKGKGVLADNDPVKPKVVKKLGNKNVREGKF